jgi:hypothetical protein
MIVRTRMRGVVYFGCSVRMNRLGCDNGRQVASPEVEARVLTALRKHLMAPEVIAAAVETYRLERQRLSREAARERGSVDRELADTKRQLAQVIRLAEDGGDTKVLAPRLNALAAQQKVLEERLALANCSDTVELHPQAAQRYATQVEDIEAALAAGDAAGLEAVALVRDLIARVRVTPAPRGEPVGLEVEGDLAALLSVNDAGTPVMSTMVAGARNRLDLQLAQLLAASLS